MQVRLFLALTALGALLAGCGSGRSAFDGSSTADHDAGASGPAPPGAFGPSGDGGTGDGCTEENKQIYVVTEGHELYRFAPATTTLTKIGTLSCPAGGAKPFSMAVDRAGTAWVLFDDGHIFKVSTKDAGCSATAFEPGQNGFQRFGMAFVSEVGGGPAETLYVADHQANGLATIDTSTLKLSFVGSYDGFAAAGELTGTGNGRLFAFFTKSPPIDYPRIVELDRQSAKIKDQKGLFGTEIGAGWAFAHWGGDFWLFTAPSGSSEITKFEYASGSTTTVKQNLGFVIVGAGVSTCAPVTPPK